MASLRLIEVAFARVLAVHDENKVIMAMITPASKTTLKENIPLISPSPFFRDRTN